MRVEILQELESDDPSLELPWASPRDPKLRYIDLKTHPSSIARLPECRAYPALARLLRTINDPKSVFRTAKCDVWATRDLDEQERLDFNLPVKLGSYIDLLFDQPELSSGLSTNVRLAERIRNLLGDLRVQGQCEIAVRRCLFRNRARRGYYLTIFTHAYGLGTGEARREWRREIAALSGTLARISREYGSRSPR